MLYIGAGGWAYFIVPGTDSLTAYSKAFDFVEVNSTFYTMPPVEMVRSWRRKVPEHFMFSVRCHRDLTHKHRLSPCQESHDIMDRSLHICRELKAEILHIQTPPSFDPDDRLGDIKDLFSSLDLGCVRLAWEVRGHMGQGTVELMRDQGIIHCTDISRELPAVESDILYTRLFGHGEHNIYRFSDDELEHILIRAKEKGKDQTYLTFHGVRMYHDTARLVVFEKSGLFPGS